MAENTDRSRFTFGTRWRHLIGFGALLAMAALVVAIGVNAFAASAERKQAEAWQLHTMEVLIVAGELRGAIVDAMRGERGYLLTGGDEFLQPYHVGRREAPAHAAKLRSLVDGDPAQARNVANLDLLLSDYLDVLAGAVDHQRAGRSTEAIMVVRSGLGRREIERLLGALDRVEARENSLLASRTAAHDAATRRTDRYYVALVALGALLVLVAAVAAMSAARAFRRSVEIARELERLATTDMLTGLPNRRHFNALLDAEVERAQRGGRPLSLALLDVDHFKQVNDRHGHPAGDEVLRAVGRFLAVTTRAVDIPARIGGEEFAILMPETDTAKARLACERIRQLLAERPIRLPSGATVTVTLSGGVALLVANEEADRLMTRADAALYDAKQAGRNRVALAD